MAKRIGQQIINYIGDFSPYSTSIPKLLQMMDPSCFEDNLANGIISPQNLSNEARRSARISAVAYCITGAAITGAAFVCLYAVGRQLTPSIPMVAFSMALAAASVTQGGHFNDRAMRAQLTLNMPRF